MKLIRYLEESGARLAVVDEAERTYPTMYREFQEWLEAARAEGISPLAYALQIAAGTRPLERELHELKLLVPVVAAEVWAAGVTYQRSREARNYEATGGKLDATTFYDKVYEAERPELFFKSTGTRVIATEEPVCIRSDSSWQVPEPELGLVLDSDGAIVGYTIGNDMSSRDIEGENPLYLPQAKVWRRSCSIGPAIRLAETVDNPYELNIVSRIYRNGALAVEGTASTGQLKRTFRELVSYLIRDYDIEPGTVLLTGTCIVPPNEFTLQDGDVVEIEIEGIGKLVNPVRPASAFAPAGNKKEAV